MGIKGLGLEKINYSYIENCGGGQVQLKKLNPDSHLQALRQLKTIFSNQMFNFLSFAL